MKVGIPRSLLLLEYMDFTVSFFESLDAQVIISDVTNKEILNEGIKVSVDDCCLPIKLFHGHVLNLIDKVDYIFVPRLTSLYYKEHICPKFGGLPELIKYSTPNHPTLISPEIDFYENTKNIKKTLQEIAQAMSIDIKEVNYAYKKSLPLITKTKHNMYKHQLPIDGSFQQVNTTPFNLNLLLLGHSYNLYDSYSNMNLFDRLEEMKVNNIVPEMINKHLLDFYSQKHKKRQYWTFSKKLIGAAYYCIEQKITDGFIYISSFACGIDSIVIEDIRRIADANNVPFLLLNIDEHSGNAGFNTRLEAFIDILERKKNNESNISTYGKNIYHLKSNA